MKKLGKISKVKFGLTGYQESCIGLEVELSFDGGFATFQKSVWSPALIKHSQHCKWTEEQRNLQIIEMVKYIDNLLFLAKVDNVNKLINIPVEVTVVENTLKNWRILTEVL